MGMFIDRVAIAEVPRDLIVPLGVIGAILMAVGYGIQFFLPDSRPDSQDVESESSDTGRCLACGFNIPEGTAKCRSCGWTWNDSEEV